MCFLKYFGYTKKNQSFRKLSERNDPFDPRAYLYCLTSNLQGLLTLFLDKKCNLTYGILPSKPTSSFWAPLRTTFISNFRFLSSLPLFHLSDVPGRRLVVTGDIARIQQETTLSSAWFFSVLGVQIDA